MVQTQQPEFPNLPPRLTGLAELAGNLWWSWHSEARMLFKKIDRTTWKNSRHNPVQVLRQASRSTLEQFAEDPAFMRRFDVIMSQFHRGTQAQGGWFSNNVENPDSSLIAYFSAEYGLHHSLPFYAGGLGFLAGDHVKECSDLGVPLVAVGFMYPEGYLHQHIREDGWQEGLHEALDRDMASISRVTNDQGEQIVVRVPLIDPPIYIAVWKVAVGNLSLYLLDTDIDLNDPRNREISARLYTGDKEHRLRQEIVLGIGGAEVLEALNIRHSILHLNEGHPAFALLERIRDLVATGQTFDEAAEQVRATSIFTTHTPVPAGHDVFPTAMIDKYFGSYYSSLGLDRDSFLRLGDDPKSPLTGFNMTAFAMRMTNYRNAVSAKHGEVTRQMWAPLWPNLPKEEAPIDQITNGVHVPTWVEPRLEALFNEHLGPNWLADHDNPLIWELVDDIPDEKLWQIHMRLKMKLIGAIKDRTRQRWTDDRVSPASVLAGGALLEAYPLTIGFARRFATYKRADLVFQDWERLKVLLNNKWRPVQIIFAGKAHPDDEPGKRMLQRVYRAAQDPDMGGRIAFVEDYDEQLAQYMVHGVDLWLNSPLPPLEASGTSGMKAALSGVPNLSVADGWWLEGYNGNNGWAFGGKDVPGDRNWADANEMYELLEQQIVPVYYSAGDDNIPHDWVRVMKAAIKTNAPRYSARRMVKEYIAKFYVPALKSVKIVTDEASAN